jgi:endoglucanase
LKKDGYFSIGRDYPGFTAFMRIIGSMRHFKQNQALPVLLAIALSGCSCVAFGGTPPDTVDIFRANRYLARTLNIAFTFDAPKEGAWGHVLKETDFSLIKDAGFTAVRLPMQWVTRMQPQAPYLLDSAFLTRIDWAVQKALQYHPAIIIDNHLDSQLIADPARYRGRFLGLWKQLSEHYRDYPQQVMFEIMAEPSGQLSALWNTYLGEVLDTIRKTNPVRPVIVGPTFYNSPIKLGELRLPDQDKFLIVTFHYYLPLQFTMQGEEWFPFGKPREWLGRNGWVHKRKKTILQGS